MEETLKTAWEAFESDVKTRLGIAIGFSIFLLCRKYIETLSGGKELFSVLAVPSFVICIIFWVTILLDIGKVIWEKLTYIKREKEFKKYMLNLSDDEIEIVKKLYNNPPQYKGYLKENNPNVLMLLANEVIAKLKRRTVLRMSQIEDINDPPVLYILQPKALNFLKEHEEVLIKSSKS